MPEKLPIVYARGYAGGTSGIDKQVDDAFYGFNDGATHVRVDGDGDPIFYQFESPLLRLMIDEDYELIVHGNQTAWLRECGDGQVSAKSIWVYRFYDESASTFGKPPVKFDIERSAEGLYDFIQLILKKTGAPKVLLVAHSMGGLICRCMLQKICLEKDSEGNARSPGKDIVNKLFTYGTPHGGIDFDLPGHKLIDWAMENVGPNGSDVFSPARMYGFMTPGAKWGQAPSKEWNAREIPNDAFDSDNVFCLIGTDAKDYGPVQKVVGPKSDGLVMIENAYIRNAHRSFVHRAHSGRYGLVNSEEGYQNLRRFLFGALEVRVDLVGLTLPAASPSVAWQADLTLSIRGLPVLIHEQKVAHYCPIELNLEGSQERDTVDAPVPLTTVFLLDPSRFQAEANGTPRPRSRYALGLRVFRLVKKGGFFYWGDHQEQTADWEDVLLVDIGGSDGQPTDGGLKAWAAWNSSFPGSPAQRDPIWEAPLDIRDGVATVDLPAIAQPILGSATQLHFTIAARE